MLDKGFKLVKLKQGGHYVEDDTPEYQHITTSCGYHVCRMLNTIDPRKSFKKTRLQFPLKTFLKNFQNPGIPFKHVVSGSSWQEK